MRAVARTAHNIFILFVAGILIAACGGGGGGRSADRTPDAFSFAAVSDREPGATVESNSVTISGISEAVPITVQNGQYRINSGGFTSAAGTVAQGQSITLQGTAASQLGATTVVRVTVGTVSQSFSIGTVAQDIEPDAFDLGENKTVNAPGATAESDVVVITGINDAAPISIVGGAYRIGTEGEFVTTAGTVMAGQSVQVQVAGAMTAPTDTTATLTVGTVSDTFTVSTEDTTPPTAEIFFPTPTTMTEGSMVTLRGRVIDDFGQIASVQAIVTDAAGNQLSTVTETPETGENFAEEWRITAELAVSNAAPLLNRIRVVATDSSGNVQTESGESSTVDVHQTTIADDTEFPLVNDAPQFSNLNFGALGSILYDDGNQRLIVVAFGNNILDVSINTGVRTLLAGFTADSGVNGIAFTPDRAGLRISTRFDGVQQFEFDDPGQRAVVSVDTQLLTRAVLNSVNENELLLATALDEQPVGTGRINLLNLDSQELTEISGPGRTGGTESLLTSVSNMIWYQDQILAADRQDNTSGGGLFLVNPATGAQSPLFDEPLSTIPFGMDWIAQNEVLLFTGQTDLTTAGYLYRYDAGADTPEIFINGVDGDGRANALHIPRGLVIDREKMIAFLTIAHEDARFSKGSFYVLDLISRERMVLSRSSFEP